MTAAAQHHPLAPDIALLAPGAFVIKPTAQGLSGIEPATGSALTLLIKPMPAGPVTDDKLAGSALALLQKKHAQLQAVAASAPASGIGWRGRVQVLRDDSAATAPIAVILTTLISADPTNPALQRCLIVALEVPAPRYAEQPQRYRQFAEQYLQIGAAPRAEPAPLTLELVPIEIPEPATPEPVAAAPAVAAPRIPAKPAAPAPARAPATEPARVARPASNASAARRGATAPTPAAEPDEDELLMSAAQGQKVLVYSILLSFVARAMGKVPDISPFVLYVISAAILLYAISGVLKIASGFRYSQNGKLLLIFCSSVPLLGIGCWIYLSFKITGRLRAAGHEVGLFGLKS